MKNRKKNISKFLKTNFVFFSLIILVVFLCANFFIQMMGDKYLLTEAQYYFADTLIIEEYSSVDTNYIRSIDGWLSILDEELQVIYTTNNEEVEAYTQQQLIKLTKGELLRNDEKVYTSMKYFTDEKGEERLGIVCIPAKYVQVTATVSNMKYGIKNILIIYMGGILVIIAGYMLAVLGLSCYMKKELTNPIYMLIDAFNEISTGNYSVRLNFEAVTEFVEIRDSFNSMVKRLFDMEEEKRVSYQQRQQLLTDIGHDLKTPTTIIQGYSSAILEGRVTEEHKEKCMRIINENATNMAELTELLLDYTRFDCADYKLTMMNYDLGEFLRQIIIEKILLFEENQINIVIDIPDRKVEAEIDFKIFKRAIINLLNNILQHNPAGINALVCLTNQKKIIIADSGELISEEIKDKIFDPFVCGDKARNPEKHNSGLGLSITKKIVEMHNGRLYLEQEWKGYTKAFIIELP